MHSPSVIAIGFLAVRLRLIPCQTALTIDKVSAATGSIPFQ